MKTKIKELQLVIPTFVSGLSPVAVKRYCQSGRPRCTIIILKYSVKQEARYHHSSERSRNHISGWLVVTPKKIKIKTVGVNFEGKVGKVSIWAKWPVSLFSGFQQHKWLGVFLFPPTP